MGMKLTLKQNMGGINGIVGTIVISSTENESRPLVDLSPSLSLSLPFAPSSGLSSHCFSLFFSSAKRDHYNSTW